MDINHNSVKCKNDCKLNGVVSMKGIDEHHFTFLQFAVPCSAEVNDFYLSPYYDVLSINRLDTRVIDATCQCSRIYRIQ